MAFLSSINKTRILYIPGTEQPKTFLRFTNIYSMDAYNLFQKDVEKHRLNNVLWNLTRTFSRWTPSKAWHKHGCAIFFFYLRMMCLVFETWMRYRVDRHAVAISPVCSCFSRHHSRSVGAVTTHRHNVQRVCVLHFCNCAAYHESTRMGT